MAGLRPKNSLEYFSKDVSLLKSFLSKKVIGLSPQNQNPRKNTDDTSVSTLKPANESAPNKSQMTSKKVKELLYKTKQKLKLNKKTRENDFEAKMKAFSGLESFIDTSNFLKNMNILNELKKSENKGQLLEMRDFMLSRESLEDVESEEEPVFLVEGKPTTKFPRLNIKEELIERSKALIKGFHNKGNIRSRYSIHEIVFDKKWDEPELRSIGKDELEIKSANIIHRNKSMYTLEDVNKSDRCKGDGNNKEVVLSSNTRKPNSEISRPSFTKNQAKPLNLKIQKNPEESEHQHKRLKTSALISESRSPIETSHKKLVSKHTANSKSTPKDIESQICNYLLEEKKLITDRFEERFMEDVNSGRFLMKWEDIKIDENNQKIQEEMKKLSSFIQNNKKIAEKLKQDLKTGVYENAFKDQAEKVGFLLKRAARNIYNQKAQLLEDNMKKENKKLKNRVLEISEFMKKQTDHSKSSIFHSKYSNVSSRYYNNSSLIKSESKLPMNNSTENLIEISDENNKEKSLELWKSKEALLSEKQKNEQSSVAKIPKSAITNPRGILKHRILSPIFLTDEKSMNMSKIEQEGETSGMMSPGLGGNLKLLKKKKSSLYEALNEDYEQKLQREEKKKQVLKKRNKLQNKELRQRLDHFLQSLDESLAYEVEEKVEINHNMAKMKEKWTQIDDKTKGVDVLRLLAKDYKGLNPNNLKKPMPLGKKGIKAL